MRSLLKPAKVDTKDIDALFDKLDSDKGGELDIEEIKRALKRLQEASAAASQEREGVLQKADALKRRAELALRAAQITREHEVASQLAQEAAAKLVIIKLGAIVKKMVGDKIGEAIDRWKTSKDGRIDKATFAVGVSNLGLQAPRPEINSIFISLLAPGRKDLDVQEVKAGLRQFATEEAEASAWIGRLMRQQRAHDPPMQAHLRACAAGRATRIDPHAPSKRHAGEGLHQGNYSEKCRADGCCT